MKDVVDSHLPLEKNAYLLDDIVKEFDLRDEYIEGLGDSPEAEKIKNMVDNLPDENGRKRFCDACLWGAEDLLPSERKALETRIKKGEI